MKKIYRTRKGIRVDEVPSPTPGDRQVLVQVLWSVISTGTETASIRKSLEASRRELTHPISLGKKAINVVKHGGVKFFYQRFLFQLSGQF